jgi:hypothetical protein
VIFRISTKQLDFSEARASFSLHSDFFFLLLSTTAQRLDCDGDGVGGYRFVPVFVGFNVIGCAQGAKRTKNVFQFF